MKRFFLFIFILLIAGVCPADDRTASKYALPGNIAADVVPAIEALAGETGSVAWDKKNGTVVVYAGPDEQAMIKELIAGLQVQTRNISLNVTTRSISATAVSDFGADVSAKVAATPTKTGYRVKVTPRAVEQATRNSSGSEQSLTVSDGCEGILRIGHEIPNEDWLMSHAGDWGCAPVSIRMQHVGASLRVKASIMPDGRTILLRITPELTGRVGTEVRRMSFIKAETELMVANGATVSLGGLAADSEFYERFLAASSAAGHPRRLDISVRAAIMPAGQ